jgi:hypothetical protein
VVISSHPDDADYNTYQKRLDHLLLINHLSITIGNAYRFHYNTADIKERFRQLGIETGDFVTSDIDKLPTDWQWSIIQSTSDHAIENLNIIGWGGVYVVNSFITESAAFNVPEQPGITINHDYFWCDDPYDFLGIYLHEARHDFLPGYGHAFTINGIFPGIEKKCAYYDFTEFLNHTRDDRGKSIYDYILKITNEPNPSPPKPKPIRSN